MPKQTILYIGAFELPDKNAAAHRVINNAKLFREIGYDVVFIDICRTQKKKLVRQEPCFGFVRYSIPRDSKRLYAIDAVLEVMRSLPELCGIIVYNYPAAALLKLNNVCKKKSLPLVADVTEWYGALGKTLVHKAVKGLDSFVRMNILHSQLDGVIAISKTLENYYKDKTTTIFLPPLTDINEEKWSGSLRASDDQKNAVRILYSGSPEGYKDKLNDILRALSACRDLPFEFRIVGITADQFKAFYPQEAVLVDTLSDKVHFLGRKTHIEAIEELKSADFSLFYREVNRMTMSGFPTKFAEAITCGVPVLTNKTSDLADYLQDGGNGFWIDNIEKDLKQVLSVDISMLRAMKQNVNRLTFDYRNYLPEVKKFCEVIF